MRAKYQPPAIEGSGLFLGSGGKQGWYYDTVFLLNNGELQVLREGDWEEYPNIYEYDLEYKYAWNGQTVSKEKYSARLNEIFDTSVAQSSL